MSSTLQEESVPVQCGEGESQDGVGEGTVVVSDLTLTGVDGGRRARVSETPGPTL